MCLDRVRGQEVRSALERVRGQDYIQAQRFGYHALPDADGDKIEGSFGVKRSGIFGPKRGSVREKVFIKSTTLTIQKSSNRNCL